MSDTDKKPDSFESQLSEEQILLLRRLAGRIVRLRMSMPAILFLESVRPLNYVGSQVMVFFAPLVRGFLGMPEWDELRKILERRESVAYFLDLIEDLEAEYMERESAEKARRKAEKSKGWKSVFKRRTDKA